MYQLSLNLVHDTVVFKEMGEKITLKVSAIPEKIVSSVQKCEPYLNKLGHKITEDNADQLIEQIRSSALMFSIAMFGQDQTKKLLDFYNGDHVALLRACSLYFSNRLSKLIAKAQRKNSRRYINELSKWSAGGVKDNG